MLYVLLSGFLPVQRQGISCYTLCYQVFYRYKGRVFHVIRFVIRFSTGTKAGYLMLYVLLSGFLPVQRQGISCYMFCYQVFYRYKGRISHVIRFVIRFSTGTKAGYLMIYVLLSGFLPVQRQGVSCYTFCYQVFYRYKGRVSHVICFVIKFSTGTKAGCLMLYVLLSGFLPVQRQDTSCYTFCYYGFYRYNDMIPHHVIRFVIRFSTGTKAGCLIMLYVLLSGFLPVQRQDTSCYTFCYQVFYRYKGRVSHVIRYVIRFSTGTRAGYLMLYVLLSGFLPVQRQDTSCYTFCYQVFYRYKGRIPHVIRFVIRFSTGTKAGYLMLYVSLSGFLPVQRQDISCYTFCYQVFYRYKGRVSHVIYFVIRFFTGTRAGYLMLYILLSGFLPVQGQGISCYMFCYQVFYRYKGRVSHVIRFVIRFSTGTRAGYLMLYFCYQVFYRYKGRVSHVICFVIRFSTGTKAGYLMLYVLLSGFLPVQGQGISCYTFCYQVFYRYKGRVSHVIYFVIRFSTGTRAGYLMLYILLSGFLPVQRQGISCYIFCYQVFYRYKGRVSHVIRFVIRFSTGTREGYLMLYVLLSGFLPVQGQDISP